MLKPENRLTKVRDFNLLMEHGRWVNGQFLDLRVLKLAKIGDLIPKKEEKEKFVNQLRLAFTVGLKVSKSAVLRNRAKRRMREAVRLLIKEGAVKNGFYVLAVARKEILDKNYAEISQEVKLLLARAKLI